MKKMLCEICGSQSIRKENGVFVCQECGTEYSIEEAKKLLVEVKNCDDKKGEIVQKQNTDVTGKDKLLSALYLWVAAISKFGDIYSWLDVEPDLIGTDEFWLSTMPRLIANSLEFKSSSITWDNLNTQSSYLKVENGNESYKNSIKESIAICKRFYSFNGTLGEYIETLVKKNVPDLYEKISKFYLNRDLFTKEITGYLTFNTQYSISKNILITRIAKDLHINHDVEVDRLFYVKKSGYFGDKYVIAPSDLVNADIKYSDYCFKVIYNFIETHKALMSEYQSSYNELCSAYKDVNDCCKELEKQLFVPYKYRSLKTLLSLIDIIKDGKANTWEDLINLYDTQQYRKDVYEKLDVITNKLDIIQQTLVVGFDTLINQFDNVQSSLSHIDEKISKIENNIVKLKKFSFITMLSVI